jgi:hypothetical protein
MLTDRELLLGIALPLVVSLLLGVIAWWLKQRWLLPIPAGAGFLIGYANALGPGGGFGLPMFPPSDGSDWLFWAAIPATLLAALAAALNRPWLALLGAFAGVVSFAILKPIVPAVMSATPAGEIALGVGLIGIVLALVLHFAAERIGHAWIITALALIITGTGVTVLSSNLRTTGVYGIGGGMAMAGLILFMPRLRCAIGPAVLGVSLLAGLLTAGRFYPEPGMAIAGATVLFLSPALVLVGLAVPANRPTLRGVVTLLAVAIAVTSVAAPAALAAKKAAEANPYTTSQ